MASLYKKKIGNLFLYLKALLEAHRQHSLLTLYKKNCQGVQSKNILRHSSSTRKTRDPHPKVLARKHNRLKNTFAIHFPSIEAVCLKI